MGINWLFLLKYFDPPLNDVVCNVVRKRWNISEVQIFLDRTAHFYGYVFRHTFEFKMKILAELHNPYKYSKNLLPKCKIPPQIGEIQIIHITLMPPPFLLSPYNSSESCPRRLGFIVIMLHFQLTTHHFRSTPLRKSMQSPEGNTDELEKGLSNGLSFRVNF